MKIKPRLYQEKIFAKAVKGNTLVVLPTGLGKTVIALMLAIHRLKKFGGKVLFLAPTRPLVEQHKNFFDENFENFKSTILTGKVTPKKREELWKESNVIFATPQTISNDLISRRISFEEVSLLIVDECHRAVENYPYVWIARMYMKLSKNPLILGLTASPGSEKEKILEICKNLFIKNIEIRSESDSDVKEYVKKKEIEKVFIEFPKELKSIQSKLENCLRIYLRALKSMGFIESADLTKVFKRDILQLQGKLNGLIASGERSPEIWNALTNVAGAIKLMHSIELLQTQGIIPLRNFIDKLKKQSKRVKASKLLFQNFEFRSAILDIYKTEIEHPKFSKLKEILKKEMNENKKCIIFTQLRDTGKKICESIKEICKPKLFVGQRGEEGMSQKEQAKILEEFKEGKFNTLVCTSIGEEGIHIPSIDVAVFFEPVPSAIRSIQRRGRVGRTKVGKVYALITKGTIDEKYYWVSFYKEKKMRSTLKKLSKDINEIWQKKLTEFKNGEN